MRKLFIAICFVLILFNFSCVKTNYNKLLDVSVYVEAYSENYLTWTGSGVVIDSGILTAAHVIRNCDNFKIYFRDGTIYDSNEYYISDYIDCGIIKINDKNLVSAHFGDSDNLKIGDEIYIVGCPFGYEMAWTLTKGIISGLNRDIDFFGEGLLLQGDAASWPGNSGGGVFDSKGSLIGILVGGVGGYDSISLIVPIKDCLDFMESLEL